MSDASGGRPAPADPSRDEDAAQGPLWRYVRATSCAVTLMTALYFLLVAFDNLSNPGSNWEFVKGVLAGDGTPPDDGFEWRGIHATWFAVLAYVLIIAGETVAGVLLAFGGVRGLLHLRRPGRWEREQRAVFAGGVVGLLVFFLGFLVIGGNWFVMYLNDKWNGMQPAFQNTVVVLFTLVLSALAALGGGRSGRRG